MTASTSRSRQPSVSGVMSEFISAYGQLDGRACHQEASEGIHIPVAVKPNRAAKVRRLAGRISNFMTSHGRRADPKIREARSEAHREVGKLVNLITWKSGDYQEGSNVRAAIKSNGVRLGVAASRQKAQDILTVLDRKMKPLTSRQHDGFAEFDASLKVQLSKLSNDQVLAVHKGLSDPVQPLFAEDDPHFKVLIGATTAALEARGVPIDHPEFHAVPETRLLAALRSILDRIPKDEQGQHTNSHPLGSPAAFADAVIQTHRALKAYQRVCSSPSRTMKLALSHLPLTLHTILTDPSFDFEALSGSQFKALELALDGLGAEAARQCVAVQGAAHEVQVASEARKREVEAAVRLIAADPDDRLNAAVARLLSPHQNTGPDGPRDLFADAMAAAANAMAAAARLKKSNIAVDEVLQQEIVLSLIALQLRKEIAEPRQAVALFKGLSPARLLSIAQSQRHDWPGASRIQQGVVQCLEQQKKRSRRDFKRGVESIRSGQRTTPAEFVGLLSQATGELERYLAYADGSALLLEPTLREEAEGLAEQVDAQLGTGELPLDALSDTELHKLQSSLESLRSAHTKLAAAKAARSANVTPQNAQGDERDPIDTTPLARLNQIVASPGRALIRAVDHVLDKGRYVAMAAAENLFNRAMAVAAAHLETQDLPTDDETTRELVLAVIAHRLRGKTAQPSQVVALFEELSEARLAEIVQCQHDVRPGANWVRKLAAHQLALRQPGSPAVLAMAAGAAWARSSQPRNGGLAVEPSLEAVAFSAEPAIESRGLRLVKAHALERTNDMLALQTGHMYEAVHALLRRPPNVTDALKALRASHEHVGNTIRRRQALGEVMTPETINALRQGSLSTVIAELSIDQCQTLVQVLAAPGQGALRELEGAMLAVLPMLAEHGSLSRGVRDALDDLDMIRAALALSVPKAQAGLTNSAFARQSLFDIYRIKIGASGEAIVTQGKATAAMMDFMAQQLGDLGAASDISENVVNAFGELMSSEFSPFRLENGSVGALQGYMSLRSEMAAGAPGVTRIVYDISRADFVPCGADGIRAVRIPLREGRAQVVFSLAYPSAGAPVLAGMRFDFDIVPQA